MGTRRLLLSACIVSLWSLSMSCSGGDVPQSGDPLPRGCTLIGCINGASYEGDFALNGTDPNSLELTACFNSVCSKTALRFSGQDASCSGELRTFCALSLSTGDSARVRLTVTPPSGVPSTSLQDGDHYEVSIGVPGQAPLLVLDSIAAYKISRPNGPLCDPLCKTSSLERKP